MPDAIHIQRVQLPNSVARRSDLRRFDATSRNAAAAAATPANGRLTSNAAHRRRAGATKTTTWGHLTACRPYSSGTDCIGQPTNPQANAPILFSCGTGEKEAELAELAEAKEDVQQAIEEVGKPLPDEEDERLAIYRSRMERLVRDAVAWGKKLGSLGWEQKFPSVEIEWNGDQPHLRLVASDYELLVMTDVVRVEGIARHSPDQDEAHRGKFDAIALRDRLHKLREPSRTVDRPPDTGDYRR
jgi:hypothetical protein